MSELTWRGAALPMVGVDPAGDPHNYTLTVGFNSVIFNETDTLVRVLAGYNIRTDPVMDADITSLCVVPAAVAVWFFPNPNFPAETNSTSVEDAMVGDALVSEVINWRAHRWFDGSNYGYVFDGGSPGTISAQGKRTLGDLSTCMLTMEARNIGGASFSGALSPHFHGVLWMKYLIESA
jgi:hypothetical protein